MDKCTIRDLMDKYKYDSNFIYEGLIIDISTQLKQISKRKGITKKQLAEIMGVKLAYITGIFSSNSISLRTLAKVLAALDADSTIQLQDNTVVVAEKAEISAIVDEYTEIKIKCQQCDWHSENFREEWKVAKHYKETGHSVIVDRHEQYTMSGDTKCQNEAKMNKESKCDHTKYTTKQVMDFRFNVCNVCGFQWKVV